jgi:RimJ/RimL family protein N-acetyltransferase
MFSIMPLQESDVADMYQEIQKSQDSLTELGWLATVEWRLFNHHYTSIIAQKKLDIYAIRVDGRYAGSVEVNDCKDHYQIGYWLGSAFRGQGIASQSVKSILYK